LALIGRRALLMKKKTYGVKKIENQQRMATFRELSGPFAFSPLDGPSRFTLIISKAKQNIFFSTRGRRMSIRAKSNLKA
jgi:hypothetical protein